MAPPLPFYSGEECSIATMVNSSFYFSVTQNAKERKNNKASWKISHVEHVVILENRNKVT